MGAVDAIAKETGAAVYMNERDDFRHAVDMHLPYSLGDNGKSYDDGDVVEAAGLRFEIIGTPGVGFGACAEGYFRFSCFGNPKETAAAAERLMRVLWK